MNEPKPGTWGACFKTATEADVLALVRMVREASDSWKKALAELAEARNQVVAAAQTIAKKDEAIVALNAECEELRSVNSDIARGYGDLQAKLARKEKRK